MLALAVANLELLIDWAMTPRTSFDVNAVPAPPRYEDDSSWSALPERDDATDQYPVGSAPIDQRTAPVDAFYGPTSHRLDGHASRAYTAPAER